MASLDDLTLDEYILVKAVCEDVEFPDYVRGTGRIDYVEQLEVIYKKLGITGFTEQKLEKLKELYAEETS